MFTKNELVLQIVRVRSLTLLLREIEEVRIPKTIEPPEECAHKGNQFRSVVVLTLMPHCLCCQRFGPSFKPLEVIDALIP